jgi:hypothetical protein
VKLDGIHASFDSLRNFLVFVEAPLRFVAFHAPMRVNRWSRLAVPVVLGSSVLCLMAVAGCGGGESSSGASPQGDGSAGGSAQLTEFDACLREHGVENFGQGQVTQLSDEERAAFQSAMSACGDLAPQGGGAGGSSGAGSAQLTEYRDCLQEHGVSGFGGGPGQGQPPASAGDGQPGGGAQLSDEERAKLEAAMEACRSLAPEGLGQPGGGSPGAGAAGNSEYRQCMSEHGVTLGQQGSGGAEAFRKATEACGSLLEQSGSGSSSP